MDFFTGWVSVFVGFAKGPHGVNVPIHGVYFRGKLYTVCMGT